MSANLKEVSKNTVSAESFDLKAIKFDELFSQYKEGQKSSRKISRLANKQRMSGGADTEIQPAEDGISNKDHEPEKEQVEHTLSSQESSDNAKANVKRPLSSTGDSRVDEMLECALENLEEAGKALANLGENLEHELKVHEQRREESGRAELLSKSSSSRGHASIHRAAGRRPKKHD